MKLALLKTAVVAMVIGLAVAASDATARAGAATQPGQRTVVPATIRAATNVQMGTTAVAAGKWQHPVSLPKTAEKADPSPAYLDANAAITGTAFVPVILADFTDNLAERTLHTPTAYHNMLFQDGYPHGAGSMRDYYQDQSGGVFDVNGQVSAWLQMPRTYATYVGSNKGMQSTEPNAKTLVKDAVAAADSSMNFCNGDTDRNGEVDTIFVIHAGPGAEEGDNASRLWSIQWTLTTPYVTQDVCANGQRVKISSFTIQPEEYVNPNYSAPGAPARLIAIGLFAHEFGHALGLPDLYDTDSSSNGGIGHWELMASGSWGFNGNKPWLPVPFGAWTKMKLGWATPQNLTQNASGVAIPSADAPRSGPFTGVYRLAQGGSATSQEYFLIENRQATGWARDFPTGGLAIWHIDDSVAGNKNDARRQVELLEADGVSSLNTYAGDLFPGTSGKRIIDGTTTPNTDSYSGADTGIAIRSIGDAGPTTRADLVVSTTTQPPAGDTIPPIMSAIAQQFALDQQTTTTQSPVHFSWSATDASGVTGYEVYWTTNNGQTWTKDTNAAATATSIVRWLGFGGTYKYAVRARDAAGNWSAYSYSNPVTPSLADDSAFTVASPWARYNLTGSHGGSYSAASQAGAYFQYTFTGRDVALIAPKFSTAGRATLYCDGTSYGLIDAYSASTVVRQVVAWCHFSQSGQHTMKIVVEGTSGRPWFGVDAFSVLS